MVKLAVREMTGIDTDKRQRVFIGIPLDEPVQNAIEELLAPWRRQYRGLRWVPAANRHLTLAFLGDISGAEVDQLQAVFEKAYPGEARFCYRFSALRRFPNARSRIVALTGEPVRPLHSLVTITRGMLRELALPCERQRFRPHVTLARKRAAELAGCCIDETVAIGMDVSRIALYRSTLTRGGAVYTVLRTALLR